MATGDQLKKVSIDASGRSLGRVASEAAAILRGKNLVNFTPRLAPKVEVEIVNISQARFTGSKMTSKVFHRFSGYPGGLKTTTLAAAWAKRPTEVVRHAVRGMLPKNRLRAVMLRNLKIYAGKPK